MIEERMERIITEFEERVIRLMHHDFAGLSQQQAAKRLEVSQPTIGRILKQIEKKAPQLFPIMTHQQACIYKLVTVRGLRYDQIAEKLDISVAAVKRIVGRIRDRGFSFPKRALKPAIRFESGMDSQVVEKF